MGQGIAQVCATHGFDTFLFDVNPSQVTRALDRIQANLDGMVSKGKMSREDAGQAIARLHASPDSNGLHADLIIEAAIEQLEVKQKLFRQLEAANSGKAILATNTSSISVSLIASALQDPTRCIGLHFFNPAERMKLVEVIRGAKTAAVIQERVLKFAAAIGKTAVQAQDSPGFIVNRVARHFYVESLKLLEDKAANHVEIDRLLRASGFKMGPFELMDLIGVDTNLAVTTSIYEAFGRAHKFAPNRIQQRLVQEGHLGRKSGRGFYSYEEKQ